MLRRKAARWRMPAMGQSRRFAPPLTTSGLPPTADITHRDHHFRKVPSTEVHMRKPHHPAYAPSPTLVPATIRPSWVHGGLDSIDLDQGWPTPWGAICRLWLDTDMMARPTVVIVVDDNAAF
jgi:hypothetical protein